MKFIKKCTKIVVNFQQIGSELLIDFCKVLNYNIDKTEKFRTKREGCKV